MEEFSGPEQAGEDPAEDIKGGGDESSEVSKEDLALRDLTRLGGIVDISVSRRLKHLDHGPAKAYEAFPVKDSKIGDMFALICPDYLVPRYKKISVYEGIINESAAKLVRHGIVYWPPEKREAYAFVYKNNLGKPLTTEGNHAALRIPTEIVIKKILPQLVGVLQDFKDRDFTHSSIRPSNIFDGGSDKYDNLIMGDALAMPSSYTQPVLFETTERAMADPEGRGQALLAHDIYALGATVACLIRSDNPMAGASDEQIVLSKLKNGSYATLIGKDRFTGNILDFIRGTINDDMEARWKLDEIIAWLDGQRLTPRQSSAKKQANRPIVFNGKKYSYVQPFAYDLKDNKAEAKKLFEDGELEQWLNRSFDKNTMFERLEEYVGIAKTKGRDARTEERLLTYMMMALYPSAPIYYKGYKTFADGLGTMLAHAYATGKDLGVFHEIIENGIVLDWVRLQNTAHLDVGGVISRFDSCRTFIAQTKKPAAGLERCLYLLNPEVRCMSEILKDYYVHSPEHMIMALEDLCQNNKTPPAFLDRHMMAFLAVRDNKMIESSMPDLAAADYYRNILGQLGVLANIQKRSKIGPLPYLAQSISRALGPVYDHIHDRELVDRHKATVEKHAKAGQLMKIYSLLYDRSIKDQDLSNFKKAMREYRTLTKELAKLESKLGDKENFGKATGKEIAAVISSILAAVIILIVAYLTFTGGSGSFL